MKIPMAADEPIKEIPETTDNYIENPFFGKELLNQYEAIDMINHLSAMLLADKGFREAGHKRRTG